MTLNIRYLLGIAVLFSFSVISAQVRTSYTFEKDGNLHVKIMLILFSLTIMISSGNLW